MKISSIFFRILLIFQFFILIGCEAEGIYFKETHSENNRRITVKKLTGADANNVIERLNGKLQNINSTILSRNNIRMRSSGQSIDYSSILQVIDSLGIKNYTFKILNHPDDNFKTFHNLVVTEKEDAIKATIMKYEMTDLFAQEYSSGQKGFYKFQGKIVRPSLSMFDEQPCPEKEWTYPPLNSTGDPTTGGGTGSGGVGQTGGGEEAAAGTGGTGAGGDDVPVFAGTESPDCWSFFYVLCCHNVHHGEYSDCKCSKTNGNIGATFLINTCGNIGVQLLREIYDPCKPDGVIGVIEPDDDCLKNIATVFVESLSVEQKAWWENSENNSEKTEIENYITDSGCSDESKKFAQKTINNNIIEKQINDTELNPCAKGVFQQIKNTNNNDFAELLNKLGADGSVYNTTMISAVAPSGNPAQTVKTSAYNYKIYISTDYEDKTKLFIASLQLHELAHAYFFSLIDDCLIENNCQLLATFPELWEYYVSVCDNQYPSNPLSHHEQIANNYVTAISDALQEFQTGLPQQVYDDLAWSGLEETEIFNTKHPQGSVSRQRILNRKAAEQSGHPIAEGTPQEQINFGQPCN